MKLMNGITFKCFNNNSKNSKDKRKQDLINNHSRGNNHSTLNPLLPETYKHLSVIKTQINPLKSISNISRKNLKLSLLVITSLTTALIFLFAVSAIRSRMIEFKIEKYQNKLMTKTTKTTNNNMIIVNMPDQKSNIKIKEEENLVIGNSSTFTLILSYDICKLINDQFFEDYILIFISFPITMLIYMWNAYKCNKDHEYHCRFANVKLKRRNREKNVNCTPNSER